MPEPPPSRRVPVAGRHQSVSPPTLSYAELHCCTNFTFLRGASHSDELVTRAAELGLSALAITDRNSLAGVVRAHVVPEMTTGSSMPSRATATHHIVLGVGMVHDQRRR